MVETHGDVRDITGDEPLRREGDDAETELRAAATRAVVEGAGDLDASKRAVVDGGFVHQSVEIFQVDVVSRRADARTGSCDVIRFGRRCANERAVLVERDAKAVIRGGEVIPDIRLCAESVGERGSGAAW